MPHKKASLGSNEQLVPKLAVWVSDWSLPVETLGSIHESAAAVPQLHTGLCIGIEVISNIYSLAFTPFQYALFELSIEIKNVADYEEKEFLWNTWNGEGKKTEKYK